MKINQLELSEFRNYETLSVTFDEAVNILYGDNAQGKTNVLEAIYLCGTTKSHKGSKDKEMIRLSSEESHIRMQIEKAGIPHRIDMHLRKNKAKGVAIDGVPIKRSSELMGLLHIVFFLSGGSFHDKERSGRTAQIYRFGALSVGYVLFVSFG